MHMHIRMCMYMHTHTYKIRLHTYKHAHTCTHTNSHIDLLTHTHAHTHARIHTYIHIHALVQTQNICVYSYGSYIHGYTVYRVDEMLTIQVADFGLTRDIYSTEYYRADKHATLPVKWMSIESLLDGYFDEKTDVVRILQFNT